ncbi:PA2169 family four-helix-bundle protein [Brevundimonas sp. GCM10030266]|uniref:PA2169 family four-helix-bundle protein n=1 Tax=Brevundimonas sp. GCM10030266 TaxID=3273386 RepID=UPI003610FA23
MSNANRHDIQVLNGLIRTVIDSADGYHDAVDNTADPGHREFFARREAERRVIADDLSSNVRVLGGEPDADGSILAKAQRAFTDVKHALLRDEADRVGAVEGADAHVASQFEKALNDSNISATTRESIRRAFARVRGGDEIHDLRHSLEGQRDANNPLFPQ